MRDHPGSGGDRRYGDVAIGRIISVKGAHALIQLDTAADDETPKAAVEIGALVRIDTGRSIVFGLIATLDAPAPSAAESDRDARKRAELWLAEIELVGETMRATAPAAQPEAYGPFRRGVTIYPTIGARVSTASRDDLARVYDVSNAEAITVGTLYQDAALPAKIRVNDMLGKHFAVLGTTGTGKSCTVALLLQTILESSPHAHVLLLDAHAEYASAFGDRAELISHRDLRIPFWALTFEELTEVLFTDHEGNRREIETLADLVRQAKAMFHAAESTERPEHYRRRAHDIAAFSVDAPLPYRISDLLHVIDDRLGSLQHQSDIALYRRIRGRVDARIRDDRYSFMFGPEAAQTSLGAVFSRLFRLPVDGKPLAILDLTGLPSEVLSVVVSLTSRLAFDFGLRSGGRVPITFICEEAHKYIPADHSQGFAPARRSIARIAKEGRKYGVSLGIVTQRPSELDPTIFSQCNTLISMRLTSERDQEIVRCAVSDGAASLMRFLPSLVAGEAIAFGDGVALPLRLRFQELEEHRRPRSASANFQDNWGDDWADAAFAMSIAEKLSRNDPLVAEEPPIPGASPMYGRRASDRDGGQPTSHALDSVMERPGARRDGGRPPMAPKRPSLSQLDPEVERQIARQIAPQPVARKLPVRED